MKLGQVGVGFLELLRKFCQGAIGGVGDLLSTAAALVLFNVFRNEVGHAVAVAKQVAINFGH